MPIEPTRPEVYRVFRVDPDNEDPDMEILMDQCHYAGYDLLFQHSHNGKIILTFKLRGQ